MLEFFKYATSDFFIFVGVIIILAVILDGIASIVKSFKK